MAVSAQAVGFEPIPRWRYLPFRARDVEIYDELNLEHKDRNMRVYQALFPKTLEALKIWSAADNPRH